MCHIAMVRSTSRVILKGLTKPDRPHVIQQLDEEEPDEVDVEVTRSVREIMMEKKVQGTKVWVLIAQIPDGRWAGYYCFGIGNDAHRAHALEWSGAVSSHIRFHLLHRGFESKGVNNLVRGSFDLQATREAAEAIQDGNGRIKTRSQAAAEQVLQRHDKTQRWVDLTLGMTKLQKEEYARQQAIQAEAQSKADGLNCSYNFEDTHSINPIKGRKDDGTAFPKTRNISLGETAYDVVLQSNKSNLDDIFNNPYSDDEGSNGVNFNMDEVHHQLGQTTPRKQTSLPMSTSKSPVTSNQKEGQDTKMSNNDEVPGSADGGGDKVGHAVLTQETTKTSSQITEASPVKDQALITHGSEGLDSGGE